MKKPIVLDNIINQEIVMEKAEVKVGIGFLAEGNIFVVKG